MLKYSVNYQRDLSAHRNALIGTIKVRGEKQDTHQIFMSALRHLLTTLVFLCIVQWLEEFQSWHMHGQ